MDILCHSDLSPGRHAAAFARVLAALRAGEFRAANVKKMAPTPYYRAELSAADRLLFRFGAHRGRTCILLLEIVENHAYDRSRFLRGASVDEAKLVPLDVPPPTVEPDALPLAYVHPGRGEYHLLDKVLSFDDEQAAALLAGPPLILIGSAGSGKTALLLERLKLLEGDVAYLTLSPFLAEHASRLYHAHGYENPRQTVDFLSFKEYLESVRTPPGRPVTFRAFAGWFARHRPGCAIKDAHRLFEEFNGVLTGAAADRPWLSRDDYLALGVRRSIFLDGERGAVYALFEKYRAWLAEGGFYDPNVEAFRALPSAGPRYDAVVVDEVQDLTNVQVRLALASLKEPERFILSGDANQIVHPNFFSWSAVKSMFYERQTGGGDIVRVLSANYRNAPCVTDLGNRILRLKNARFGSVDRESTMLARSVADIGGEVHLIAADPAALRDLDGKTCRSTRVAAIVLREEDKAAARAHFRTPLVFSVQEAKGLEYETIVAFDLVGSAAKEFSDIADGVSATDLDGDFRYARARDKADKSLDAYKFFVNALFVAVTRAVRRLFVVESNSDHAILALLGLRTAEKAVEVQPQASTADEWKREARKLEMQGRDEQAEAIRRTILAQQPVPWRVLAPESLAELDREAFDPARFNNQAKGAVFEYAVTYDDRQRLRRLSEHKFKRADRCVEEAPGIERKLHADYFEGGFASLRRKLDQYGVNFRNPVNQTPLMVAAHRGLPRLVEDLVAQGADPGLRDNFGRTAFHIALRQAFLVPGYLEKHLGDIYDLLAPESVNVKVDGRLHKIDRRRMEFFVFQTMMALFQDLLRRKIVYTVPGLQTGDFVDAFHGFPARVLPAHRRHRGAVTAVLAGHELFKVGPRNLRLFLRLHRGYYVFNPDLEIEVGEDWVGVYSFIGLERMAAEGDPKLQRLVDGLALAREKYREWIAAGAKVDATARAPEEDAESGSP